MVVIKTHVELARELVKLGMPQKDIAERPGITQSDVTPYIQDKR